MQTALVITSIAASNHPVLNSYASHCKKEGIPFYMIGDKSSPAEFELEGCDYYSLQRQRELDLSIVKSLPEKHYGRKNIGYLLAIRNGADQILETDDDNYAHPEFWLERKRKVAANHIKEKGWVNVYEYYTKARIWPRGFALEKLQDPLPPLNDFPIQDCDCPIQQGLANENPDVDAIYRLILPLPLDFEGDSKIALGNNTWCPFNSQNTTWFKDAFPLMYLPSYCSFRMTDIWRSFIAQRIAWENNWNILFHPATVWQERNMHNLMRDFSDEISGYMNNLKIAQTLEGLDLRSGLSHLGTNLLRCYEAMVNLNLVDAKEIPLVEAWLRDQGK
ncbi:MAG: DUF288 domain-containing protein [Bacteroidetes bacterium]|nr:DUF288 domain-containing protein [Bacteroidota bacterium]